MNSTSEVNRAFAAAVGDTDLVHAIGGNTRAELGGSPTSESRPVRAPSGVVEFLAEEMIVRVGAGTPVDELDDHLAQYGQLVALPGGGGSTVGGALSVGRSGLFQLGYGLVRDTLLEAQYVTSGGHLLQAGAPVVKNVSGFDLCRLLVGSLGTLGLLSEVVLRTRPLPAASRWLVGTLPVREVIANVTRPAALLATDTNTYVCIEGAVSDVDRLSSTMQAMGMSESAGPTSAPTGRRYTTLGQEGTNLAVGEIALSLTGIVLTDSAADVPMLPAPVARLNNELRLRFDPDLRFNRGRQPWATAPDGAFSVSE